VTPIATTEPLDGLVLLDKPLGLSSHGAVQKLRRLLGAARAGHVGSLDPLASGMLPICIGEATKIAGIVAGHDKCYRFTLMLGRRTTSGDAEGAVIEELPVPALGAAAVAVALTRFVGPQEQTPPMYSAIKQHGQPLYRLARQGKTVERAARTILIHALDCLGVAADRIDLRVRCSKGTYVRVLGEDIAKALGTCGHLGALRRDWVEPFVDARLWTLEQVAAEWSGGSRLFLLPTSTALPGLPRLPLDADESRALLQGKSLDMARAGPGTCWLQGPDGRGIGLGQVTAGSAEIPPLLRPQRMFVRPLP
jgi:tRNA pseudouridine55 synthase